MALSLQSLQNRNSIILPFRLYIGSLFIYASLHKIEDPSSFAQTIANFEVLPHWSINAIAIVLPWIELLGGIFLVLGVFVRSNALVLSILLIAFAGATLINVLRGSNINCGCFLDDVESPITAWTVIRDIIWFAMTVTLVALERRMFSWRKLQIRL
jgi:uncharacterized membrane protein YphA (DoxX/SURF4 family)